MNFELDEAHAMIQKTAHDFAKRRVLPLAAELDETGRFPTELVKEMAELGFMGMAVPERYGGAGLDSFAYALAMEEIARGCASTAVIMSVNNSLVCDPLMKFGTDAQKERYLIPLAKGAQLGCFCLSEPSTGSDAAAQTTTAKKTAEGWLLQGTKNWITNGKEADVAIVFAMVDKAAGHKGIGAFIVPCKSKGFEVAKLEKKLGIKASSTAQIHLDNVLLPHDHLLGAERDGFKVAMATLDGGRIGIAAQALGICRAALEDARDYAKERKTFGTPVADKQAIQFMFADIATELDAARLLVWRACHLKDSGQKFSRQAAMAKLYASETAMRSTIKALQIFGGYGYVHDYPAERHMRDAKITEIYEGTSEIQRLVIAQSLLEEGLRHLNFDLLLKGGELVTDGGLVTADLGVRDGLIVAIGRYLASDRLCPVFDVRGKWVAPGMVELYGQLGDDSGEPSGDTEQHRGSAPALLALSQRAAMGGVTLLVTVVQPRPWESVDAAVKRAGEERPESWVNRAFAVRVLSGQVPDVDTLRAAKRQGLAYIVSSLSPRTDGLGLDDDELYVLLGRAAEAQVSVAVWLENTVFARAIKKPTFRALAGNDAALLHRYSDGGELVQAARALAVAEAAGTPVGLLGVTAARTLALAKAARARGVSVTVLGFAQSLLLSSAVYARRRGRWYRALPPLRSKQAMRALSWHFVRTPGAACVIGSGLPPLEVTRPWRRPTAPGPAPLALLPWAPQALLGKLLPRRPPGDFARAFALAAKRARLLLSENAAAFAGHRGERGNIRIGSVADLVIYDPRARLRLGPQRPKNSDEFNPLMAHPALGPPWLVVNRGRIVVEDGVTVGDTAHGQLAVPFSMRAS